MKRLTTLALAVTVCASQAAALSCMRPSVGDTFNWAAQSDKSFVVLLGSFDFTAPHQRSTDINAPDILQAQATFRGQSLGADGFRRNVPLDVTLTFSCAGPWCGSLPDDGSQVLAFVERTETGYEFDVGPCGRTGFVTPTADQINQAEACIRGETCEDGPPRRQ